MSEVLDVVVMPQAARLRDARVKSSVQQAGNGAECYGTDVGEVIKSVAPVFPLEVFPEALQVMMREGDERLNYGIAFTGCSMLFAAASAIGNSCVVKMNSDWLEGVTLWMVLVGHPGTGKGHALKRVLKEIELQDAARYKVWMEDMKTYKRALAQFNREKKKDLVSDADAPEIPVLQKTILSDVTPEKMGRI